MGITSSRNYIDSLRTRLTQAMIERKIVSKDILEKFTNEQLTDIDSMLQIAYFTLARQDVSSRSLGTLEEIIKIIEDASTEAQKYEHRSEEILARAEAAVSTIRECHRRSMPNLGTKHE